MNKSTLGIDELTAFPYSSLPDYLGVVRESGRLLEPSAFPEYFANAQAHLDELREWLDYNEI